MSACILTGVIIVMCALVSTVRPKACCARSSAIRSARNRGAFPRHEIYIYICLSLTLRRARWQPQSTPTPKILAHARGHGVAVVLRGCRTEHRSQHVSGALQIQQSTLSTRDFQGFGDFFTGLPTTATALDLGGPDSWNLSASPWPTRACGKTSPSHLLLHSAPARSQIAVQMIVFAIHAISQHSWQRTDISAVVAMSGCFP